MWGVLPNAAKIMNSPTTTISNTDPPRQGSKPNAPRKEEPPASSLEGAFEGRDTLLRSFFEHAGIGLAIVYTDGRFFKVNPALCAMLGYSATTLLTLSLQRIMAQEDWRRLMRLVQELQAGKRSHVRLTLECRHRSGRAVRGLINVSMLVDRPDTAGYLLFQIQDISSLIHTEAQLEGSRQRYRALSDATFEAVFISSNGICIDANRTASTLLNTPREELIGIFGTDVIAPEYKVRVRAKMLSGYEAPYHAMAVKKDGTRFHVMIQGKMTCIDGKDVRVTVLRDIDAQMKAEAALRESERHLRSLMESASNFVLFRLRYRPDDPDQPQRIFISPSIAEIVDPSQVVDFQSWLELIHRDDKELLLSAGQEMLVSHKLEEMVRIADRSGDGWRWLHIICTAVPDETDPSLFFNGIILDITSEVETTAELKARERELKERTENLSEVNTALEVLLQKREADRLEVEEKMLANAKSLILPYLEKLKASRMNERQRVYLDLVETNLNEIISPLSRRMSRHYLNFTPLEIQVANLVKEGKPTKDIALVMGLSARTIEAVRYTIRRKLGIKKKRVNLRSYLLSIDGADSIPGSSGRVFKPKADPG